MKKEKGEGSMKIRKRDKENTLRGRKGGFSFYFVIGLEEL